MRLSARLLGARNRDVDDAASALFAHVGHDEPSAADGAEYLELDVGFPGFVADLQKRAAGGRPRVVDQDVDTAEFAHDRADESLDVRGLAHVRRHSERCAPGALDFVDGLGHRIRAPRTNGDAGAFAREHERGGLADTVGAAGHDGDFTFQPQFHCRSQ
jgi:hypothetical protein